MSDYSHLAFGDWQEVIQWGGEGQLLQVHSQGLIFGSLSCASVSQCDVEMALSIWQPETVLRLSMVPGKERKSHALAKRAELQYLWVLAGRGLWASGCV